jgi:hypothetical protein
MGSFGKAPRQAVLRKQVTGQWLEAAAFYIRKAKGRFGVSTHICIRN